MLLMMMTYVVDFDLSIVDDDDGGVDNVVAETFVVDDDDDDGDVVVIVQVRSYASESRDPSMSRLSLSLYSKSN